MLRVRDTGIGIAPDMLPRIFELFVQVDHASTTVAGRAGHRPDLVKNLVEMHGGTVEAHSDGLGQGASSSSGCRSRRRRLDQDRGRETGSRPTSRRRLRATGCWSWTTTRTPPTASPCCCGCKATRSGSPTTAWRRWRWRRPIRPDVVFLDIGMPGMDGYEVARRLRQQPGLENVVLAALTGWGQRRTAAARRKPGSTTISSSPRSRKPWKRLLADLKLPSHKASGGRREGHRPDATPLSRAAHHVPARRRPGYIARFHLEGVEAGTPGSTCTGSAQAPATDPAFCGRPRRERADRVDLRGARFSCGPPMGWPDLPE